MAVEESTGSGRLLAVRQKARKLPVRFWRTPIHARTSEIGVGCGHRAVPAQGWKQGGLLARFIKR